MDSVRPRVTDDNHVQRALPGSVTSWGAIQDARDAAWAASGVTDVDDQLKMW